MNLKRIMALALWASVVIGTGVSKVAVASPLEGLNGRQGKEKILVNEILSDVDKNIINYSDEVSSIVELVEKPVIDEEFEKVRMIRDMKALGVNRLQKINYSYNKDKNIEEIHGVQPVTSDNEYKGPEQLMKHSGDFDHNAPPLEIGYKDEDTVSSIFNTWNKVIEIWFSQINKK